ncbi:MAG: APC family permease [Gemmatimonadetes bacterium]|nr:APC family permease [Gemmatimonadota bacterium]
MRLQRSLGTAGLVFVMFFTVSGGAFTMEALVATTGPGVALLLLVLVPVCWALPESLLIGELASMLPEEGGYYRWVRRAFGPFWAFQNGWLTWCYSLVDMAIFQKLFTTYLAWFVPGLGARGQWAVALAIIWGSTALNLRGARPVGRASLAAGLFITAGFFAFALAALPQWGHAPWHPVVPPGSDPLKVAGLGLSITLWNFIGWDNASTVGGEIVDAERTYPRALAIAVPLVTLGYLLPVGAGLAATDWTTWREGGWPAIALQAAGPLGGLFAPWLAIGGMVSALGMFNASLLAYSRIPAAMADDGLLPARLADTDERGTPKGSVLASAVVYSVAVLLPFSGLVIADVVFYALALTLEFGALVALRRREPALRGPFRIPLGTVGVTVLAALPVTILAGVIGLSLLGGEYEPAAIVGTAVGAGLGPLAYRWLRPPATG